MVWARVGGDLATAGSTPPPVQPAAPGNGWSRVGGRVPVVPPGFVGVWEEGRRKTLHLAAHHPSAPLFKVDLITQCGRISGGAATHGKDTASMCTTCKREVKDA